MDAIKLVAARYKDRGIIKGKFPTARSLSRDEPSCAVPVRKNATSIFNGADQNIANLQK
jgi:hypothetical protein